MNYLRHTKGSAFGITSVIRPLPEGGLLWFHHVLFLFLFLFLVLVQSQKSSK